ncbi:hypothetical protein CASFOL_039509 [Castilleja foliolosa]|uniref:Uncharacterized protein n=1 Tax=Castilleja foliolosa TaxID=1961234 RepID=A0ABD3BI42_9LAMI
MRITSSSIAFFFSLFDSIFPNSSGDSEREFASTEQQASAADIHPTTDWRRLRDEVEGSRWSFQVAKIGQRGMEGFYSVSGFLGVLIDGVRSAVCLRLLAVVVRLNTAEIEARTTDGGCDAPGCRFGLLGSD